MTIYHPRVGMEVMDITATGTDRASAAVATTSVGETFIIPADVSGGIVIAGATAGDKIVIRQPVNAGITVYLPAGESYGSVTDFTINQYTSHILDLVRLTKVGPTEWHIW